MFLKMVRSESAAHATTCRLDSADGAGESSQGFRNSSGSFATLAAIRRASSLASGLAAEWPQTAGRCSAPFKTWQMQMQ